MRNGSSPEAIAAGIIGREEHPAELARLFAEPAVARDAARSIELKAEYERPTAELSGLNGARERKLGG